MARPLPRPDIHTWGASDVGASAEIASFLKLHLQLTSAKLFGG